MAARTDGDSNAICVLSNISGWRVGRCFVLGLVQLEADLREVVKLGDCATFDFSRDATFEDAVEKGVNVGFFGEVHE